MHLINNLIRSLIGVSNGKQELSLWNLREIRFPLISIFLSFLFPPIGCITFLIMSRSPKSSPRYKVSIIALYLGSLLSVLYTFLIAMFLLSFTGPKRMPYVSLGSAY